MTNADIYKLVYEIVTEAMIVADRNGTIVQANPAASQLFEYPMDCLVGMNVDELLPDALRKAHQQHRENYVTSPQRRSMGAGMDLLAQTATGKQIPVEISLNHANTGGAFHVVALITDISTRKEAEQKILQANKRLEEGVAQRTKELDKAVLALEESQHLYSLIAHNFPDGTINVLDRDLKYVFAEGMEFARFGTDQKQILGTDYLATLSSDDALHVKQELEKAFKGVARTFELIRRNNTYILNAVPLVGSENEVDRILLVEKNISEQKQAEQDMISALVKERELNELKSRFVSMASHEFRTPLATILSSLNLVVRHADNNNPEGIEKHVARIRSSVENLTSILNDFLSLEKLEQGKVHCRPEEFDMYNLVHSVCEEIDSISKDGQQIERLVPKECLVQLDPQLIRNILLNLLSNAVKYSPENSVIHLSVALAARLEITIKDEGMGIPKEDQQHLFERFFRAKNATNIQGTGLGLNIVKKHVDLMQGTINFESIPEQGTTFIISLPRELDKQNNG